MVTFRLIKQKYGLWSSWAVWSEAGDTPKSNVGDLAVFDRKDVLKVLNPRVVLVGLNISRGAITQPLANFHDSRPEATDFKIRYALKGTPLWGGYMTDIIKDYDEQDCRKVMAELRKNRGLEESSVAEFRKEISDLGPQNPTIVAFGRDAYSIVARHLKKDFEVWRIPHYAIYASKEKYRQLVGSVIPR
jgi:hypothetical protein